MIYKKAGSFESTYAALKRHTDLGESDSLSSLEKWIGRRSKTSDKRPKSSEAQSGEVPERERKKRYTIHDDAECRVRRSIVPERTWPFQSLENRRRGTWRHVTTPHTFVHVCTRVCVHSRVNLPEKGRGSRVARVTYCRAWFTRDALDKFSRPTRVSDSSGSRTIVKIHGTYVAAGKAYSYIYHRRLFTYTCTYACTYTRVSYERYRCFTGTAQQRHKRRDRVGKILKSPNVCMFIFIFIADLHI